MEPSEESGWSSRPVRAARISAGSDHMEFQAEMSPSATTRWPLRLILLTASVTGVSRGVWMMSWHPSMNRAIVGRPGSAGTTRLGSSRSRISRIPSSVEAVLSHRSWTPSSGLRRGAMRTRTTPPSHSLMDVAIQRSALVVPDWGGPATSSVPVGSKPTGPSDSAPMPMTGRPSTVRARSRGDSSAGRKPTGSGRRRPFASR